MKLLRVVDEKLHAALQKLSNEQLPLKTAFKLKGINKLIKDEFAKYDEVRKEALQKHGLKNEDGSLKTDEKNNVKFDQDGMKGFIEELNELSNMEVEIPTISLSELGSVNLTAAQLEALDGVVVED